MDQLIACHSSVVVLLARPLARPPPWSWQNGQKAGNTRPRLCFCKKGRIETGSRGSTEGKVVSRNEKTALEGGLFGWGENHVNAPPVTGRYERQATQYPTSLAAQSPINQAPARIPVTKAHTLALCRTCTDWTSSDCCRRRCVSRVERGDSAYDPNAQRRTSARHTHRQVWENRPRGSQGP